VRDGVGIGVSGQSPPIRDVLATQDKRPALDEGVTIVANTNANHGASITE